MCQLLTAYEISEEAEERWVSHVLRRFSLLAFEKRVSSLIDQHFDKLLIAEARSIV